MKFEQYSISDALKANLNSMGIKRPTDIQYKCIPPILKDEDLLAVAQTGTGKTIGFALPIIEKIDRKKKNKSSTFIHTLVLTPTRELALQVTEVFKQLEKNTKCSTACIFGGVEQDFQIQKLSKGIDVLIATPGRLFDLQAQGYANLNLVQTLILDEADHMLDLGFIKDIQDLQSRLSGKRQTLFFSATINPQIKKQAYKLIKNNAIRIQISPDDPVSKNVEHAVGYVDQEYKKYFLERFVLERPEQKILTFVRTKVRAERVHKAMKKAGIVCQTLHGDLEQQERLSVLDAFKSNKFQLLIATDISARGIDIPNVDFVVNYDLPDSPENYVHRIGRTGRGKNKGLAISFCSKKEEPNLLAIEKFIGKKISVLPIFQKDYEATIDFNLTSETDKEKDWKSLIEEEEKRKKKGK